MSYVLARTFLLSTIVLMISACSVGRAEHTEGPTESTKQKRTVVVTEVLSQVYSRETRLPADLLAYRDVAIYPKVSGFVDWIGVDRGSKVKKGQLLIAMSAPELSAQNTESLSQAKAASDDTNQVAQELAVAKQQLAAARAKCKASADTYTRFKGATETYAGVISENDLEIAQKTAEADAATAAALEKKVCSFEAQMRSSYNRRQAAVHAAASSHDIQSYLQIKAAFDGMITERNVHEGSFVHPPATETTANPLLRLQQLSLLRLVVPVPETDMAGVVPGATVTFTVSSFPAEEFQGVVRRVADSVDVNTRTMAVEMDVQNNSGKLAPGMFAEVAWPVKRREPTLFVPRTAVVKTTERTFVIRIRDGVTDWVDVKPGFSSEELVEVFGDLHAGDQVVVRGTDELRPGTNVSVQTKQKEP